MGGMGRTEMFLYTLKNRLTEKTDFHNFDDIT